MLGKAKKSGLRETRYYKQVGLGIKTPRTAIEGTYVDKKCPWTGTRRAVRREHGGCGVGRRGASPHAGREEREELEHLTGESARAAPSAEVQTIKRLREP